jgi:hypothetical protein
MEHANTRPVAMAPDSRDASRPQTPLGAAPSERGSPHTQILGDLALLALEPIDDRRNEQLQRNHAWRSRQRPAIRTCGTGIVASRVSPARISQTERSSIPHFSYHHAICASGFQKDCKSDSTNPAHSRAPFRVGNRLKRCSGSY